MYFTGKPLSVPPVIGQMVLAHYTLDENYYRAIVTAVEDKKVRIKYIDYGNDEDINMDKLFELSEELKEVRISKSQAKFLNIY